jgi:hypothetical protein
MTKYNDIKFKFNQETVSDANLKKISGNIYDNGGNCYYIFDASNDVVNIKLYSVFNELVYNDRIIKNAKGEYSSLENYINSLELFLSLKSTSLKRFSEKKITYIHDFPYFNISLNAVSLKFYFDARTTSKMFSFFPLEIKATFYPLKYLEVGAFIRFDVGEMVYKYRDLNDNSLNNYDSPFDISYGFFCGFSLFGPIAHYSAGIMFYNIFYNLNANYKKQENINSYFLPQFAIYQKVDFKLFKFLNYTIFFNLKTMPLFYLDRSTYFYSKPFSYDFFIIEFSLIGISLTF